MAIFDGEYYVLRQPEVLDSTKVDKKGLENLKPDWQTAEVLVENDYDSAIVRLDDFYHNPRLRLIMELETGK